MSRRLRAAAFLVVVAAWLFATPASRVQACGPFIKQSVFWWRDLPDLDAGTFARGQLGIVSPRYAPTYLIVAYRTLSDRALTDAEAQSVEHMWAVRLHRAMDGNDDTDRWEGRWQKARTQIPGVPDPPDVNSYRKDSQGYAYSRNVLGDAFKTATETMRERSQRYGARSPNLRAWVHAQDLVFAGAPPADVSAVTLPGAVPEIARADRAYQVAAAAFYSGAYADARKGFLAIAADTKSPWRRYGTYLAARAALREGELDESRRLFEAVAADPSLVKLHQTASGLVLRVRSQQEASETFRPWLAGAVLAPHPGPLFGDLVRHLSLQLTKADANTARGTTAEQPETKEPDLFPGEEPGRDEDYRDDRWRFAGTGSLRAEHDLIDWIVTMQSTDRGAASHALTRWRQTRRTVWLVAAISGLRSIGAAGAAEVVQAAATVPASSPAYATVVFHRARLLIDGRRPAEARPSLDAAIAQDTLPVTARNRLRDLRLRTATSYEDLVKDIGVPAAGLRAPGYSEYSSSIADADCGFIDDLKECASLRDLANQPQLLPRAAALVDGLPLALIRKLGSDDRVTEALRRDMTQTAWVRAMVTGDDEGIRSLAQSLATLYASTDAKLASDLARLNTAATPGDRKFEAAWILVRYPAMSPFARPGLPRLTSPSLIDNYQDNWWDQPWLEQDKRDPEEAGTILRPAPFLDAESKRQAIAEHRRLRDAGTAGSFMARAIVEGAATHTADSRLPEALYRSVRATRFAGGGEWSRKAFTLLHKQFPKSPWTRRTTVWY